MSYDAVANAISTMSYEEQVSLMELLIESIKHALPKKENKAEKKKDFTDSYPEGYFDLFGSDPTFPEEPEEVPIELDSVEIF